MQLTHAEEWLRANDMAGGMTFLNAVRTNAGAPRVTPADITDDRLCRVRSKESGSQGLGPLGPRA